MQPASTKQQKSLQYKGLSKDIASSTPPITRMPSIRASKTLLQITQEDEELASSGRNPIQREKNNSPVQLKPKPQIPTLKPKLMKKAISNMQVSPQRHGKRMYTHRDS